MAGLEEIAKRFAYLRIMIVTDTLSCCSYEFRFQLLCKRLTDCCFIWLGKGGNKSTSGVPGLDSLMICIVQRNRAFGRVRMSTVHRL